MNGVFALMKIKGSMMAKEYPPVIPLIPSMKLYAFDTPTHTIRAMRMIHQLSQFRIPNCWNIRNMAINCTTKRMLSGKE